jgi:predicted aldo/keto reductase-like oxidoreductase
VEKCPQSLPIPDLLEQVVSQFEGDGLQNVEAMVRGMFQS